MGKKNNRAVGRSVCGIWSGGNDQPDRLIVPVKKKKRGKKTNKWTKKEKNENERREKEEEKFTQMTHSVLCAFARCLLKVNLLDVMRRV
jgi:hypothetical protein